MTVIGDFGTFHVLLILLGAEAKDFCVADEQVSLASCDGYGVGGAATGCEQDKGSDE